MEICVLCKKKYIGYGNNAEPIKKGQCCDDCNSIKVVPERIKIIRKNIKQIIKIKTNRRDKNE